MIKLYHAPRTRSARVVWLLEELGLPYTLERVLFRRPVERNFVQDTPCGKVPALEDGEVTMIESGAMVEYLLERYGAGRLAPRPGEAARAAFLQWCHFAESTAFAPLTSFIWLTRYRADAEHHPDLVSDARERAAQPFAVLEAALGSDDYLLGADFSAADIMAGFTVFVARSFGVLEDGDCPRIDAWYARLAARPAFVTAMAKA